MRVIVSFICLSVGLISGNFIAAYFIPDVNIPVVSLHQITGALSAFIVLKFDYRK